MDSRDKFFHTILSFYQEISVGNISQDLLVEISNLIADYYFAQYSRFRIQYPKSIERYSSFLIKDLDHPDTFEIIINFFKEKYGSQYNKYSTILLNKTESELYTSEKNRADFHNR